MISTLDCWFRGKPFGDVEVCITGYLFASGVFSNRKNANNSVALQKKESFDNPLSAKVFYLFRLLFPKREKLEKRYTIIKKHPGLLPWYYLRRLFESLFRRSSWKALFDYHTTAIGASEFEQKLSFVGLGFDEIEKDIW